MKVQSLIQDKSQLIPVQIELSLLPGLPQIHFLGLPDQVIKESLHRIKSAMKSQGFEFPRTQQILVNIRPNHLRKSSRGLEFAVACALLWETQQSPPPLAQNNFIIYGELGLGGEVYEPEDLCQKYNDCDAVVLTGRSAQLRAPFARQQVQNLRELTTPQFIAPDEEVYNPVRPTFGLDFMFTKKQARLMAIAAVGEHHTLFAGSAGAGKSTMAKAITSLLAPPQVDDFKKNLVVKKWRPIINPHHSASALSMVGGGVPPREGEITRAHRGVLILDELLEFAPTVQEALREPIEEKVIRVVRGSHQVEFPAEIILLATTNLCPCGGWLPRKKRLCNYTARRCESTMQKLSGPFLDRFDMLYFVDHESDASEAKIAGREILEQVCAALKGKSQFLEYDEKQLLLRSLLGEKKISERRRKATLRVAQSIALIDGVNSISYKHLREALDYTLDPFIDLLGQV